jgi:hypothetical protein
MYARAGWVTRGNATLSRSELARAADLDIRGVATPP